MTYDEFIKCKSILNETNHKLSKIESYGFNTNDLKILRDKLNNEINYFYKQNGFINVADFYTYVQDKDDILVLLNSILADNYNESTTKEELKLYFDAIKDYSIKQEIKRLNTLMKKEVDPLEQAKLAEKIRKLRIGE